MLSIKLENRWIMTPQFKDFYNTWLGKAYSYVERGGWIWS
jgi:hypothetical protein